MKKERMKLNNEYKMRGESPGGKAKGIRVTKAKGGLMFTCLQKVSHDPVM